MSMNTGWTIAIIFTGLLCAGCAQELMPTPNLCVQSKDDPFANVPPALQTNTAEVVYATDRAPIPSRTGGPRYGHDRSKALTFGICTVEIGHDLTWKQLVQESRTKRRSRSLPLTIKENREIGQFPAVPDLTVLADGTVAEKEEVTKTRAAVERQFAAEIQERLSRTAKREVYVYVHGFNNSFEDAAFVMAGLWHFMGRTGVPVIYTWPAGSPEGMLGGYTHDSESGQFTGYHLRYFLRTLAACPQVEKIHLIAHSRGTDVLMTALRELNLECRSAGKQTRSELKLGNLVLAAADLDLEVTSQRISAELLPTVPERMTVYVSEMDRAIGAADVLFGSKRRIGQLRGIDLTPETQKMIAAMSQMQIIDVRARTGFLGHSYFHANPAVSSDVILVLRDNRNPGADNGRPLTKRPDGFYELNDAYPH